MIDVVTIDDAADPRLADYVDLKDGRDRETVIVEGPTALEELVGSPYPMRSVLCLPKRLERVRALLGAATPTVYVAPEAVLRATVGFNLHRGIVAAAERAPAPSLDEVLRTSRTLAIVERLNDHENLGALFRNARAFGVDAVLLDPETADPLYRRAVRVSMGHVLRVPFTRAAPWPAALGDVRAAGFDVVALTPAGDHDLHQLDRRDKVAFLLGAEGAGLSAAALDAADGRVRIAMADGVDSVNVATAAAIAFHWHRAHP